jgi:hypothetical protein
MHRYAKNGHVPTKDEHSKKVAQNEPGRGMVREREGVDHYSSVSVPSLVRTDWDNFSVFEVGGEARAQGLALSVLSLVGLGTETETEMKIEMAVGLEVVEEVVGRT